MDIIKDFRDLKVKEASERINSEYHMCMDEED